ncbi:MAG TPA: Ku protein [Streptosporangiaceae bacterium]|jgi:DNA end-binding protein Ku
MARAIWSGVLTFGLVSVPVELYSATETHRPVFHQFEKDTTDRIRYQRVNERTADEVEYSDIVKGAETSRGHYVMLDQEELDSVAPGRSRSMEIHTFVDLDDIDPIYFDKTYYLGPGGEESSKVYALLRSAMGDSDKAAIASFVMRGKEYLAAVRADGDLLALETLFFADEIREAHEQVSDLPGRVKLTRQELRMARQLIESMTGPWRPSDYRDTYTDRVNKLIKAKKNDEEFAPADEAPPGTKVVDLTEALRASVAAAKEKSGGKRGGGRGKAGKKTSPAKKTGSAKPAAKKAPAAKKPAKRAARKRAA